MKDLSEPVDRFLDYLSEELDEILSLETQRSRKYKKTLISAMLDTLAKTTSHQGQGNRDRFVAFIKNFCDWQHEDRVSLTHLLRVLEQARSPEFSQLREYAFKCLEGWSPGEVITLDKDPEFAEVQKLWPRDIPKPIPGISIESLTHAHLFYSFRNGLVHELREMGQGMDVFNDAMPIYHSMIAYDSPENRWELIYPLGFYEGLVRNALGNLRSYYINDRINPYDCFRFGSFLIEPLN